MNKKILTTLITILFGAFLYWHMNKKTSNDTNALIVGTNAEFPPFCHIKDGKIVGFDIDIIHEVAKRMGKRIEIKDMPFDALIPEIQLGSLHVIAAGMTATPDRSKKILFSQPYLSGDPLVIITLKNQSNTIKNAHDLIGKEVIVNEGYTADTYMSDIAGVNLIRLSTPAEAFLALNSGRADAFVSAKNTITPFFDIYGKDNFTIIPIKNSNETTSLAISRQHAELLEPIEDALSHMKEDGTIESLKKKWHING